MSALSSIGTSTWIALGVAGIGAGIGAKVAVDHDQSWALGALIGGAAGFAGAKLVAFGVNKFNARLMRDAASGAASIARTPGASTGISGVAGSASTASSAGTAAAQLAPAAQFATAAHLGTSLATSTGGVAGTTLADDLFRSVMLNHGGATRVIATSTSTAVHSSTTVARMIAANVPTIAAAAPRIAAPIATSAPRLVAPIVSMAAPTAGGGLVSILKAFVPGI